MVKRRHSFFEGIRRLKRKIRFLYRRGTLFHANPNPARTISPSYPKTGQKQKGPGRLTRIIKVIRKRGLFPSRDLLSGVNPLVRANTVIKKKRRASLNLFLSYRKLRYLYYKSRGDKPFHSPSSPPPSYLVNVQKQKGPGRLTRVIRVIKKRGFVPNRNLLSGAKPVVPGITVIKRKKGSGLNLTLSYRKL